MFLEIGKFIASLTLVLLAGFIAALVWANLPLIIGFPIGLIICAFLGTVISRYIYGVN